MTKRTDPEIDLAKVLGEKDAASTEIKAEAIRQAANRLLETDHENHRLRADSERLEWLMRNVSGAEFRRLGIVYSAGCGRADIDQAMCEQEAVA